MEKYEARHNEEMSQEEVPQKTAKEERQESSEKAAKVIYKGLAEYAAPGEGGKIVDALAQTEAGQQILEKSGEALARNPLAGRLAKKLDDEGKLDQLDQAMDMLGGSQSGGDPTQMDPSKISNSTNSNSTNNSTNSNPMGNQAQNNSQNSETSQPDSSDNELDNDGNSKEKGNSLEGLDFDILGLGKKYRTFVFCAIFFFFVICITAIVAAKDYGNLALTNNSQSMNGYAPQSINVQTPGSISQITGSTMNGNGGTILSGGNTLNSLLGADGVTLLNQSIANSASMAGYGTGAAPAAAAQALITNLLNNGIVLPYFLGGGHGAITSGVDGNLGSLTNVSAGGHFTSGSNQPLGFDCSGFVSWALYNGGCKNFGVLLADQFKNLGPSIDFSNAKTGDIAASSSHVVLILENRGNVLLCAEAKGSADGVVFTERSSSNLANYKIVDMSSYYQQNCI